MGRHTDMHIYVYRNASLQMYSIYLYTPDGFVNIRHGASYGKQKLLYCVTVVVSKLVIVIRQFILLLSVCS